MIPESPEWRKAPKNYYFPLLYLTIFDTDFRPGAAILAVTMQVCVLTFASRLLPKARIREKRDFHPKKKRRSRDYRFTMTSFFQPEAVSATLFLKVRR